MEKDLKDHCPFRIPFERIIEYSDELDVNLTVLTVFEPKEDSSWHNGRNDD